MRLLCKPETTAEAYGAWTVGAWTHNLYARKRQPGKARVLGLQAPGSAPKDPPALGGRRTSTHTTEDQYEIGGNPDPLFA